jgi:site-specific recombinase XerD
MCPSSKDYDRAVGSGRPGSVTSQLLAAYRKTVETLILEDYPLDKHIAAFLSALQNRAVSEHTLNSYESDLRDFAQFLATKDAALESIDHVFVRQFLNYLYEKKLQKSSVARKLACLRTFFKFMLREGRLNSNPAELIASPRLPKKLPSYLDEAEAAVIVETPQGSSLKELRDRAILELLYASGLRLSEIVGLNSWSGFSVKGKNNASYLSATARVNLSKTTLESEIAPG